MANTTSFDLAKAMLGEDFEARLERAAAEYERLNRELERADLQLRQLQAARELVRKLISGGDHHDRAWFDLPLDRSLPMMERLEDAKRRLMSGELPLAEVAQVICPRCGNQHPLIHTDVQTRGRAFGDDDWLEQDLVICDGNSSAYILRHHEH